MSTSVFSTDQQRAAIREIADSGHDRPVLMLNLNRYFPAAAYPDGEGYRQYMDALERLLPLVGGRILWRSPVFGQPLGEQPLDEILAVWYPTHRAFLELRDVPGDDERVRYRQAWVEYAVIHWCLGDQAPLAGA